ncbi:MAG: protoheme IX farnesyltransferase [Kordiimonadaceae bacterium]|nr:protoheme IX farnesyltransferase [Kordiimonadaceae bacterium]MBO6567202.1 protoheme IX farnesyltransferase [Kordiimonadaceae bacterium]MBO6963583.1 protoheme IX farnesyltransferase [Kordiimonadaceae bacterium]
MTDTVTPTNAANEAAYRPTADAGDFIALLKPRVMSLVIFTAFVGMLAAPGGLHPVLAIAAITLIAIGAGASGALNMWYDADIDAHMARTANRPIPAGKVAPGDALGFGLVLSIASIVLLGLVANVTAAALLALTIFFYVVVYTMWLKRRTPQNIVIGGAAGAFPPMIGWAAVTDSVTIESIVLFGIIFLWTPPHFWALSLFIKKDYENVGVPMLPVVAGARETRKQIWLYTLLMVPCGIAPYFLGFAGPFYGAVAGVLGTIFLVLAFYVWRGEEKADKKLFLFSIFYLFGVFAALAGETIAKGWLV